MTLFRLAIAFALLAPPTFADEVWDSDMGPIIYEYDEGGAAFLSFVNTDAYPAMLIIPGLAGNYEMRGRHAGYWIGEGAGECATFMAREDVPESSQWGRATVVFDTPAFPTSVTILLGYCEEEPSVVIRGEIR